MVEFGALIRQTKEIKKINMAQYDFRIALQNDAAEIWQILSQAIERRKDDGSLQWQDGYPNPEVIQKDILGVHGYVLTYNEIVIAYVAVYLNDEPEYAKIQGNWLSNGDFLAIHRVAVSADYLGKGLAKQLLARVEELAASKGITSIKADTNFDNAAMINIFVKLGYVYCGEVYFRGSPRRAYEKLL